MARTYPVAFLMLSYTRRPSRMACAIDEKSSSRRTRSAASRATSVPRAPIAIPMSAALKGGRVVHAVPGHGDHRSVRPEGAHEAELLLGNDAREDVRPLDSRRERGVVQAFEIGAGHDVVAELTELPRDVARRPRIIPRDHDRANARA